MRCTESCTPIAAAALCAALLSGCAHTPPDDPSDPLEPVNRAIYAFNETADSFVTKPAAKAYDYVLPTFAKTGIRNFFTNLFYPTVILNDVLQFKLKQAGVDLGRLLMNSTFGLGGLIDIASIEGLPLNDEDFGQTLGYWGLGPGWYLMLPFLGPSDNRDLVGSAGDYFTSPLIYLDNNDLSLGLGVLNAIDERAQLLSFNRILEQQLDRYVFIRTIYLQNRLNKVHDGNPPKEDFGFEEDETTAEPEAVAP